MHNDIESLLLDEAAIHQRIRAMGAQISTDYAGSPLVVVGILRGSFLFMADLVRAISLPVRLDFMQVSSYEGTATTGTVTVQKDVSESITGANVLVIEDIIDTGITLAALLDALRARQPQSLRVCTLLDKQRARTVDVPVDYVGFTIPDVFVVGYGLDYNQFYRNLPYIGVLKPAVYTNTSAHEQP